MKIDVRKNKTISNDVKLSLLIDNNEAGSALVQECEFVEGGLIPDECLDWFYLGLFEINPEYRGNNLGRVLLSEIIRLSEENKRPILVEPKTFSQNKESRQKLVDYYLRNGFLRYEDRFSSSDQFLFYMPKGGRK